MPFIIESNKICEAVSWMMDVEAITIYPVIICRDLTDKVIINHESIHVKQQLETLLVGFYLVYILHYLINLIRYRDSSIAYENIIFEREAYNHENDFEYLNIRKTFTWLGE